MKSSIALLLALCLLAIVRSEDTYLRDYYNKANTYPHYFQSYYNNYLRNISPIVTSTYNDITDLSKVSSLTKVGIPKAVVDRFVSASKTQSNGQRTFPRIDNLSIDANKNYIELTVGLGAFTKKDDKIRYSYIEVKTTATMVHQKQKIHHKRCKKFLGIKIKCKEWDTWEDRPYSQADVNIMKSALEVKGNIEILNKINILKNISGNANFMAKLKSFLA